MMVAELNEKLQSINLDLKQVPLDDDGVDALLLDLGYHRITDRLRLIDFVRRYTRVQVV